MGHSTARQSTTIRQGILALVVIVIGAFAWILLGNSTNPSGTTSSGEFAVAPTPLNAGDASKPSAVPLGDLLPDEPLGDETPSYERHIAAGNKGTIRGRVTASAWVPWPAGVRVVLTHDGKNELDFVATKIAPTFRFDGLEIGSYELRLAADGFRPMAQKIRVREAKLDGYYALPLLPDNQIKGLVRDLRGLLVPGILVTAVPVSDDPSVRLTGHPSRTDDEGHFIMRGLRPGTWRVYPGDRRNPLGQGQVIELTAGMREAWVNLEVPSFGSAHISLVTSDGQKLPKGLRVMALRDARKSGPLPDSLKDSASHLATIQSDADGMARFSHLPPGQYTFTAFGSKFRRTIGRGAVREGGITEVTIQMRAYGNEQAPR
ncbi:MAG: carboxypeptidase regulatory-like domain-containing protein [Planctomycetes bacterium]|jgi:hypothetical protein|nr:carboxypeptidase regulatory-like domain-containing protein [Planctomycetota bacterium]MBT4029270.1 carboxypeptidase regulatory-like domain-containing protein [Planctomycetota bacterium]MBT4560457.1 carboxypeptidase regulatory-like domain-containing protein [Planctomycetota bacterium]MBT7318701.1 carboxypeptidase regulatory-like domain-containing protein [Planctomycetota bacterium]